MALQYNDDRPENARVLVEVSRSVEWIRTFGYHKSWAKAAGAASGTPFSQFLRRLRCKVCRLASGTDTPAYQLCAKKY